MVTQHTEEVLDAGERAAARLREIYREHKVPLPATAGIGLVASEVEAVAARVRAGGAVPPTKARRRGRWLLMLVEIVAELDRCAAAGCRLQEHLKQMRVGELELGVPSSAEHRISLKDFWYEVHVLARLLAAGVSADFTPPSDPVADIDAEGLLLQLKHPSSPRQLRSGVQAFGQGLRERRRFGLFCVGLEDVLRTAQKPEFLDAGALTTWVGQQSLSIDCLLEHLLMAAFPYAGLLGFSTGFRCAPSVGGKTEILEFGSTNVVGRLGVPSEVRELCLRVATALTGSYAVLPPFILPDPRSTTGIRRELLRMNGPATWKQGERIGLYQTNIQNPELLCAWVWEYVGEDAEGPLFELCYLAGATTSAANLPSIHSDLMRAIKTKKGTARMGYLPDANQWFARHGVTPHGLDPREL